MLYCSNTPHKKVHMVFYPKNKQGMNLLSTAWMVKGDAFNMAGSANAWSLPGNQKCELVLQAVFISCFQMTVQAVSGELFIKGGHHNWHDSITTTILNSSADFYHS
jgi:hypothetical protein